LGLPPESEQYSLTINQPTVQISQQYFLPPNKQGAADAAQVALALDFAIVYTLLRPCLVNPKTKKFLRFFVTSNLSAHALSIKYR
jgi:hypothetical protein